MIRLENVIKIYGEDYEKKIALNNICLEIKDGEFVAVTGPSGSGKSTLLNIIGCMDIPTKGRYYLDDTDITLKTKSQIEDIRKENRKSRLGTLSWSEELQILRLYMLKMLCTEMTSLTSQISTMFPICTTSIV